MRSKTTSQQRAPTIARLASLVAVCLLAIGCSGSHGDGGATKAAYRAVTEIHAELGPGLTVARYEALIGNARRRVEDIQSSCKEALQSCQVITVTTLARDLNTVLMGHEAALALSKRILEVGDERQLATDPQVRSLSHTAIEALVNLGADADFMAPVEQGGALHSDLKLDLARVRELLWSAASNKLTEAALE